MGNDLPRVTQQARGRAYQTGWQADSPDVGYLPVRHMHGLGCQSQ